MYLGSLETRPFNKFVEIELERDALYDSFTELDEKEEISRSWVRFAGSCAENLSIINNIASLAYNRINAVLKQVRKNGDNPLALHQLLYGAFEHQLLALTEFQLKLAVMTYVYSQVRNRGVFNIPPKDKDFKYYVNAKETLDVILYRIFNNELEFEEIEEEEETLTPVPTVDSLKEILFPLLQLENMKRLIPIYKSLPNAKDPEIIKKIGEYDRLQGITLLQHIVSIAKQSGKDFWWDDPISNYSILSHAKEHFDLVIKLWKKYPGRLRTESDNIKETLLLIVESELHVSLVKHYQLLAEHAFEKGNLEYAAKYLDQAVKEIKKAEKIMKRSKQTYDTIKWLYSKESSTIKILKALVQLAIQYNDIVDYLSNGEKEKAIETCLAIEKNLKDIESSATMPYIYGVSIAYASGATIINELVKRDASEIDIIHRLTSQFYFPLRAMSSAINEIDFNRLEISDENPIKSYQFLSELEEQIVYLEKAIELLPPFIEERDLYRTKIHTIKYLIKSLLAENQIYLFADNNIVLDLIMRSRAHYLAKKAQQYLLEMKKGNKKLKELVEKRLITTKLRAMVTESNLLSLAIQNEYTNVRGAFKQVAELVMQGFEFPKILAENLETRLTERKEFNSLLELMQIDTEELLALEIEEATIKGQNLNWVFVKRRKVFISIIKKFCKVVENILVAEMYLKHKPEIAISKYSESAELLYKVTQELEPIVDLLEEEKEMPTVIYTASLNMREHARAIKDRRKKDKPPLPTLIEFLDYFVTNL